MRPPRFFVPEVVQTSAMDCGPACLAALLAGFRIPASYGGLRDACHTGLDGTSIDTLEEITNYFGLLADQVILPPDHLFLSTSASLPCILTVVSPGGALHFILLWNRVGDITQVMDPVSGRRWSRSSDVLQEAFLHTMELPADAWREWAGSPEFRLALKERCRRLHVSELAASALIDEAAADLSWRSLASLDASIRMVASIQTSGALHAGEETETALRVLFDQSRKGRELHSHVPRHFWATRPPEGAPHGEEGTLLVSGIVLVRVRAKGAGSPRDGLPAEPSKDSAPLERARELGHTPSAPLKELWGLIRSDGSLTPLAIAVSLLVAAGALLLEALVFRSAFSLASSLGIGQRLGAIAAFGLLLLLVMLLDLTASRHALQLGRSLEVRWRLRLLQKLAHLQDRYLQSRPASDQAERCHSAHRLRLMPDVGRQLLRACFELFLTGIGAAVLAPETAHIVFALVLVCFLVPVAVLPVLGESDLRLRTQAGALSRFYLDVLLGQTPIRAHGAADSIRNEQEALLVEWMRSGFRYMNAATIGEAVQATVSLGLAAWLLFRQFGNTGNAGEFLLYSYWVLNLPITGVELASLLRQYPARRSVALRLLEPLGAPETTRASRTTDDEDASNATVAAADGVSLAFEDVSVQLGGHTVLRNIDLTIPAGQHVAVVGSSGAGKSTLVGVMLGWYRPERGRVVVNGETMDEARCESLRERTAWLEPGVQIWNRSLLDNILYGGSQVQAQQVGANLARAALLGVVERLPDGLRTALGENGRLVSGGEGQRVRLARVLSRPCASLALLDEPFRGLERELRSTLLTQVRAYWSSATLLCVTHDIEEVMSFTRVLVFDSGRLIADGSPSDLLAEPGSTLRALLESEQRLRAALLDRSSWTRWSLSQGELRVSRNESA